jgi:hypothetical protein
VISVQGPQLEVTEGGNGVLLERPPVAVEGLAFLATTVLLPA